MNRALLALAAAATILAVPAQAQAPATTVAEFLSRVQALISGGQPAPDSPAMQRIREDIAAAGRAVRAQQQAEREAGRPATLCIPEQAAAENDLLTHLMAIPAERRNMPLSEGFVGYVRGKYPCPRR